MLGRRTTNAMVDCKKQHPQQIITTIGTLGGLIGVIWKGRGEISPKPTNLTRIRLTLKLFLTRSTTNVPEIGQMQRVMLSIRFSVMQTSVLQLGS